MSDSLRIRPRQPAQNGIEDQVKISIRNGLRTGSLTLAGLASVLVMPLAAAQGPAPQRVEDASETAATSAQQGEISIPENVKIFTQNDPNLRRATAVVNGGVVTGTDVDQRLALILAANENKPSEEERTRLRLQVLRNLIDETLQIQAAQAAEIDIRAEEVDQTYARVAAQNFGQNPAKMDDYLVRVGSSPASLKRQIRGELSWQRLLSRNVAPFVNVSDDEVREVMNRLEAAKGTDEFRVGEIYLAANPEDEAQVGDNARRIVEQLKGGGSFVAYARQYSQASTAAVGGDLGWIRLAQLPTELAQPVAEIQPGQLVGPIKVPGGYSIIYLIDKRKVLTADPRDAVLALKQVSINFPANTSESQATARAKTFAEAMRSAKGCGAVDEVAAKLGAQVVANDQVRARDLPGPLQNAVLTLNIGETSPPFGSIKEGVRVLMLCGRDDGAAASGPNFEQLQSQIEDDRINKRAQMYLRDLRRDAVIEYN